MKYILAVLLAFSLSAGAAQLSTLDELNLECFVYGTYAEKRESTLKLLWAQTGEDKGTLRFSYLMGKAEGMVIGKAMHIKAANYAAALKLSGAAWYDIRKCYVPKET